MHIQIQAISYGCVSLAARFRGNIGVNGSTGYWAFSCFFVFSFRNIAEKCSVCGDNSDALSGVKCNECKSFICDDCVIVQKISKKIGMIGNETVNTYFACSVDYEVSILEEVLAYKSNNKMIGKVKSSVGVNNCLACCLFFSIIFFFHLILDC